MPFPNRDPKYPIIAGTGYKVSRGEWPEKQIHIHLMFMCFNISQYQFPFSWTKCLLLNLETTKTLDNKCWSDRIDVSKITVYLSSLISSLFRVSALIYSFMFEEDFLFTLELCDFIHLYGMLICLILKLGSNWVYLMNNYKISQSHVHLHVANCYCTLNRV